MKITCPNCGKEIETKKKAIASDHQNIIDYFHNIVVERFDFKPVIDGVDAARVKSVLTKFTMPEVLKIIDHYIESPKAREMGITLSIALSKHSINVYQQSASQGGSRFDQLLRNGVSGRAGARRVCGGNSIVAGVILSAPVTRGRNTNMVKPIKELSKMEVIEGVGVYGENEQ